MIENNKNNSNLNEYIFFLKGWIKELKRVKKNMKINDNHGHWYLRQGEVEILIDLFKDILKK